MLGFGRTKSFVLFLLASAIVASIPWWESWQRRWLGPADVGWLEEQLLRRRFPAGAIRLAEGKPSEVCHDWTFREVAEGVPLGSEEIDPLLSRQGYFEVLQPEVGDVVIYRDVHGVPSHSGRVRALGSDGLILVESKWGTLGRFLHEPELPGLPLKAEYYRRPVPAPVVGEALVVE